VPVLYVVLKGLADWLFSDKTPPPAAELPSDRGTPD
jgi:hypothetical protein